LRFGRLSGLYRDEKLGDWNAGEQVLLYSVGFKVCAAGEDSRVCATWLEHPALSCVIFEFLELARKIRRRKPIRASVFWFYKSEKRSKGLKKEE
jgi:hypothetical protein